MLLMSYQLVLKTVAVVWFESNKSTIAAELCENRDQPEMNCNGRCVLSNKIAAAESRDQNFPLPSEIESKLERCVVSEVDNALNNTWRLNTNTSYFHRIVKVTKTFPQGVFHPPKAA